MTTRRRTRTTPAALALSLALSLALAVAALAGCSGDDSGDADPGAPVGSSAPPAAAPPLETKATIGRVTGSGFPDAERERLKKQIRPIVDRWIDGAYVGGSWPRTDVGDAFAGFSAGARRDATTDLRLMSNADIGDRVTAVRATKRTLLLDVLAVRKRAVSVTARLDLRFTTTGEVARSESVRGRLFLTRGPDGWEVFGYDVTAGEGGPQAQQPQKTTQKKSQKKTQKRQKTKRKGSNR